MVTPEKLVSSGRPPAGRPFRLTLPKRKRKVENPRRSSTHTPASNECKAEADPCSYAALGSGDARTQAGKVTGWRGGGAVIKRKYPLGEYTSDGHKISACYGSFFADRPAPSPARFGFYFFRLVGKKGWYWQCFDLENEESGLMIGPFPLLRLAVGTAEKKRLAVVA